MSQLMPVGTVKWFSPKKGFGFLLEQETGEEVFVHHTAIRAPGYRKLEKGARVRFKKIVSERGLRAAEVEQLDPPPAPSRSPAA